MNTWTRLKWTIIRPHRPPNWSKTGEKDFSQQLKSFMALQTWDWVVKVLIDINLNTHTHTAATFQIHRLKKTTKYATINMQMIHRSIKPSQQAATVSYKTLISDCLCFLPLNTDKTEHILSGDRDRRHGDKSKESRSNQASGCSHGLRPES